MFPFRGMPVWAQWIGEVLPLTHFLRIIRGVMLKGNVPYEVWPNLWPIAAFMLAAMALALLRYRRTVASQIGDALQLPPPLSLPHVGGGGTLKSPPPIRGRVRGGGKMQRAALAELVPAAFLEERVRIGIPPALQLGLRDRASPSWTGGRR